jgi:hypothetical protein
MLKEKEPLYRKVNTRARGVRHNFGGDYSNDRNTKAEKEQVKARSTRGTMHGKKQRGLDYTPLFRFLLSKVGEDWTSIHSEAVARLDKPEPIFWLVALDEGDRQDAVRVGESSYFSGLYVDEDNKLQKVDPSMGPENIVRYCNCCTWTFNGIVVNTNVEAV